MGKVEDTWTKVYVPKPDETDKIVKKKAR